MQGLFCLVIVACALGSTDALLGLRGKPAVVQKAVSVAAPPTEVLVAEANPAAVLALHKQLDTISISLNKMLNAKDGSLAHAKVAPAMKVFLKELQTVLQSTSADKKVAPSVAMKQLLAAKAGLAGLMADLNDRQVTIMKEDNAQRESLLLGVLMTRQKDPMDKQLEILKDDDFAPLEVSKALLAKHNATVPLYVQAAGYLDQHPKRKSAPMRDVKPTNPLAKVQTMLETRLSALEHEYQVRDKLHQKKAKEFADRLKNATSYMQHTVHIQQKREERNFKKWSVMRKHDIDAMKEAVAGVKKGDMKAVARAREALQASLKSMQSQTGGFLYLIQLHHKLMQRDCPYCAAQCVDKCHQAGKPYVQCLTDCADAGKA
jgi:hypothetical protein